MEYLGQVDQDMSQLGSEDEVIKDAIQKRILNEIIKAQTVIATFYRRRQEEIRRRFYRKIGLFDATVYLECHKLNDCQQTEGPGCAAGAGDGQNRTTQTSCSCR